MNKPQINSRELVLQTIQHKVTHKVPKGELVLDDSVISNFLKTESIGFDERVQFVNQFGLDLISLSPKYTKGEDFSIDCTDLEVNKWAQNTSLFTFVILDGAFEYGLRSIGFGEFMSMMMNDTDELQEFISKVEKLNCQTASKLADSGIDGIIIADDIAIQNGLMMRPEKFRELFLPSLEKQVRTLEDRQLIPFFHSDGNYLAIIEDIINAGFKGIHCIDKKCNVNLNNLKPYADKLCLWGHLDVDDLNSSQDSNMMTQLVQDMKTATDFKGCILGTNSGLFSGMNVHELKDIYENVDAETEVGAL